MMCINHIKRFKIKRYKIVDRITCIFWEKKSPTLPSIYLHEAYCCVSNHFKLPLNRTFLANQRGGCLHVLDLSLAGLKIAADSLHGI